MSSSVSRFLCFGGGVRLGLLASRSLLIEVRSFALQMIFFLPWVVCIWYSIHWALWICHVGRGWVFRFNRRGVESDCRTPWGSRRTLPSVAFPALTFHSTVLVTDCFFLRFWAGLTSFHIEQTIYSFTFNCGFEPDLFGSVDLFCSSK